MANKSFVRKLPGYIQTPVNKKFFSATVDQLYCKKDSEHLNGYIGRRVGNQHDPINDFYLPEPTKERTWRQLEPTVFSVNADTLEKTNIVFYDNFIDYIKQYGGNVGNHDRLFSSNSYSFAPPIDYDKFINYQNYYWVPDKLPVIDINGMDDNDVNTLVIGEKNFNTNDVVGATPADLEFTSGLRVRFMDSASYNISLTIEGVGNSIRLVEDKPDTISDIEFSLLAWDAPISIGSTTWNNEVWDILPWDAVKQPLGDDYITIERGSLDCNAWSRSNKWYHVNTINTAAAFTSGNFPQNAVRAFRPIIEFIKDIELYDSGLRFLDTVTYVIEDTYADIDGQTVVDVTTTQEIEVTTGDTFIFPNDAAYNQDIYVATVTSGVISLAPAGVTIAEEDIVFAVDGPNIGQTYYFNTTWIKAANQKTRENQPPLFNLYDIEGTELSNTAKYPNNDFTGSEIFSYKINEDPNAENDVILGFPVEYKTLGTAADIVFENDLETERYNYIQDNLVIEISGYYYFRNVSDSDTNDSSLWSFDSSWVVSSEFTKQRVVDRYVVGFDADTDYRLSVTPVGFDEGVNKGDVEVFKDGVLLDTSDSDFVVINGDIFYQNATFSDENVIEIKTYTKDLLDPDARGYFEIPSQLESNPSSSEITEYSIGEFSNHFVSIISNQDSFQGVALGGPNNYKDTEKDGSKGDVIIQNEASMLRSMMVSSSEDLDLVSAIRYSQNEYNKFKSKFSKTAKQLIDRNFIPTVGTDDLIIDEWMEEIIKTVTISKEFSNSFAYSYMIGRGDIFQKENLTLTPTFQHTLTIHADLTNPKNVLYLYRATDAAELENAIYEEQFNNTNTVEKLLVEGVDYVVDDTLDPNDPISLTFLTVPAGTDVCARIYEDSAPAYIPSTPSKLGCYPAHLPELVYDESFVEPCWVIVGHDGSRTPTFGDYDQSGAVINPDFRDNLLLELERRIFNGIEEKFRDNYNLLLKEEDVKSARFRNTDYSLEEFLKISKPHFTKWTTRNKLDFMVNDYYDAGDWKTWNYRTIQDPSTGEYWPGHWKGIYEFYYDTFQPHISPWNMLGFAIKPEWWDTTYTSDYSSNNTAMWDDLENGLIADGTGTPGVGTVDDRYVRTGMMIPVDASGDLIDIPTLFSIAVTPPLGAEDMWGYGDCAPVEQSWKNSSEYPFAILEILYLTRPSIFGEVLWNPRNLEFGIGEQLIDVSQDSRRKNDALIVHGETQNSEIVVNTGFEVYVTDRLLFLGKNITDEFGDKVRSLNVNLGYKMAGYSNADTLRMFLDGSSPESVSNSLQIPNNNYQVSIHTSPAVGIYAYSGVIIRAEDNGTFIVYGYDLLNLSFKTLSRSPTSKQVQINEAGKPADFTYFDPEISYQPGDIVKYNSVFYEALQQTTPGAFNTSEWRKLAKLPTLGGINVSYKPQASDEVVEVPYGTIFNSTQEVFDFLISYGDYLESEGWIFDDVDSISNQVRNWLTSAKEFLFWSSSDWETNSSLFLSPSATGPKIKVDRGYPASVEKLSNGVYSILDKNGVAILPSDTQIERDDQLLQVNPKVFGDGIFYTRVTSTETEHIIMFDNTTDFNDVVYDPVLGIRQNRLRFNGRKSNGWFGKFEAPGYLIVDDQLIQNYDNIVESIRNYYDSDVQIDNVEVEDAARHLIGYEAKEYLTNLELVDDAQYQFYQGFVRDKGTESALTRILRSDFVQNADSTEIFEEWAFKVSDFGGECERTQIDFVINPSDVQANPQIVRLNHNRSDTGFVAEVNTFNAQDVYGEVPEIVIDAPTGANPVQATAVAVLDEDNKIGSIIMDEVGSGYTEPPAVTIIRNDTLPVNDILYAVYQPEVTRDTLRDEIIDIDIDDNDSWLILPQNCNFENMPMTDQIDYQLPNAGYVHRGDVNFLAFDPLAVYGLWNSTSKPDIGQTIWVAKTVNERFNVYLLDTNSSPVTFIDNGTDPMTIEVPGVLENDSKLALVDANRNPLIVLRNAETNSILTATLVSGETDIYTLSDETGAPLVYNDVASLLPLALHEFRSLRISNVGDLNLLSHLDVNGLFWADDDGTGNWVVGSKLTTSTYSIHRTQGQLIDTKLYENAFLYDRDTKDTIVRLPVYDPFKGIIPGRAEQNVSYKTFNDPARYTNSDKEYLIDPNRIFGEAHVGELWWDLNAVRYMYYEQPAASGEDESQNLIYRRNNWGKLFPGSTADIYEWTKSTVPPATYNGDGEPKNTTDYVQTTEFNHNLNQFTNVYYFWVKNGTKIPNRPNRTLTASSVASLLTNPRASGYEWFSPVKRNDTSDSYVFANVDRLISNIETVAQINYDNIENANESHVQWKLLRENDPESIIPDFLWNKYVDSLVSTTDLVPLDEYEDAIPVNLTEGVLLVPDPKLSDALKYGNAYRPRQSMFVDLEEARRVFVQVSNRLLAGIPIREIDEDWNAGLTTNNLWNYDDWFEVGYDANNTVASRQVETAADLTMLGDAFDGEIIKVLPFTPLPGTRARYYEYVADGNYFGLVRIEDARIVLSDEIYEGSNTLESRSELRELLEAFKTVLFVDDEVVGINTLFFAGVNFTHSEQNDIDWVFKTSYIYITQDQQSFDQNSTSFRLDPFDNVKEYMEEAKPYRTKIRDIVSEFGNIPDEALVIAQDDAVGVFDDNTNTWSSVTENLRFMDIEIFINRTSCVIPEIITTYGTNGYVNIVVIGGEVVDTEIIKPGVGYLVGEVIEVQNDNGPAADIEISSVDSSGGITGITINDGGSGYICDFDGTIINAYRFNLDGWDANPWESIAWDSLNNDYDDIVTGSDFLETNYQYIFQGQNFATVEGLPEDVVPVVPTENIILTVRTEDPLSTMELEYKQHLNPLGYSQYVRMSGVENADLTTTVDKDSEDIEVDDASTLYAPTVSPTDFGVIWIEDERIEYYGIDGNRLIDIRRGTLGTSIVDHASGTTVYDGTSRQMIPNANDEWWINNANGLTNSTTEQAEFLKEKPIIS